MSSSGVLAGPHPLGAAQNDGLKALALAVLLELFLLGFAAFVYTSGILRAAPVTKDSVVLQLGSLAPEPTPPTPPPPRKVEKRSPEPRKAPTPLPQPAPTTEPPLAQNAAPSPFAEKPAPSPPAQPPRPTEADVLADYAAKIRNAVQSALIFPMAAEARHDTGRTRVEFRLYQGQQSGARVIVSSGINMLDRAALQAVQDASYPQPPEGYREQVRVLQVWVEFKR